MFHRKDEFPAWAQGLPDLCAKGREIGDIVQHQPGQHEIKGCRRVVPIFDGMLDDASRCASQGLGRQRHHLGRAVKTQIGRRPTLQKLTANGGIATAQIQHAFACDVADQF